MIINRQNQQYINKYVKQRAIRVQEQLTITMQNKQIYIISMQYLIDKVSSTYNWIAQYYYSKPQPKIDYSKLSKQKKILTLRKILNQYQHLTPSSNQSYHSKTPNQTCNSLSCQHNQGYNSQRQLNKNRYFSQQVRGKIQMQFTKLIQTPLYENFIFTTQKPIQYPVPLKSPSNKVHENRKQQQHQDKQVIRQPQSISFVGEIVFQSERIKCPLTISCLIESTFPTTTPKVYVDYPTLPTKQPNGQIKYISSIPNPQFVQITNKSNNSRAYKYKGRTGGIQVLFNKREDKITIKQLIDESIQMMKAQFPFLKRKYITSTLNQQTNRDQQTQHIYQLALKLKHTLYKANQINQLGTDKKIVSKQKQQNGVKMNEEQRRVGMVEILDRSQQLDLLLRSINSQINYTQQLNLNILENINMIEKESNRIQVSESLSSLYPVITQDSKVLYEVLADSYATKDCLISIQSHFKHPTIPYNHIQNNMQINNNNMQNNNRSSITNSKLLTKQQLNSSLNIWLSLHQNLFYQRIKINQIIQSYKQSTTYQSSKQSTTHQSSKQSAIY